MTTVAFGGARCRMFFCSRPFWPAFQVGSLRRVSSGPFLTPIRKEFEICTLTFDEIADSCGFRQNLGKKETRANESDCLSFDKLTRATVCLRCEEKLPGHVALSDARGSGTISF